MAYENSVIITGGKRILNNSVHPENRLTFEKKIKPDKTSYVEINCKIIINDVNYINFIRTAEDFTDPVTLNNISNLIILDTTKKNQTLYELDLDECTMSVNFDKNEGGKILLDLTTRKSSKTDHGSLPGKTDHSAMPGLTIK